MACCLFNKSTRTANLRVSSVAKYFGLGPMHAVSYKRIT